MSLNPGTRIRVFTSNWLALYAVKGGSGWELELIVTPKGVQASVIMRRELSYARVDMMLTALNTVKADYDADLQTVYPNDDLTAKLAELDRVFGPAPKTMVDLNPADYDTEE